MTTFFETDRLIVRGVEFDDLDPFAALCADPIAMQYMDDGSTLDLATVERWIGICHTKYRERGYGTSAVIEKASGAFIGFCGVIRAPDNDFDEIVYALAQSAWGKGYATEVAQAMLRYVFSISNLKEIYATINSNNQASLRMMDKIGMQYHQSLVEEDGSITKYFIINRQK